MRIHHFIGKIWCSKVLHNKAAASATLWHPQLAFTAFNPDAHHGHFRGQSNGRTVMKLDIDTFCGTLQHKT
jgi:hypothetical protein